MIMNYGMHTVGYDAWKQTASSENRIELVKACLECGLNEITDTALDHMPVGAACPVDGCEGTIEEVDLEEIKWRP